MATADQEVTITYFCNPFLQCDTCGKRAVGIVGPMNQVVNLLSGLITISIPGTARNWPCFDVATRTSICSTWSSTTGCTHSMEVRAQHSNILGYEGVRK